MKKLRTTRPAKPTTKQSKKKTAPRKPFPIVGFGASAGGIEAFSTILEHLAPDLGMAYVLVMHLSPNHKSALAEILRPKTKMPIHTVKDGMEVKADNVYVIPPNTFMSIVDGHLKLAPRAITAIGNYAIDYFLTALADVYKNNSIGVILSGTATDGTLGLKAIKTEGGITFSQDSSAKFPSMPRHAYESGYADFILSPQEITKELGQLIKTPYAVLSSDKIQKKQEEDLTNEKVTLQKILAVVKAKTGVDFLLHYKQASVFRRVARRVALFKFTTLDEYLEKIKKDEGEVSNLYNDFLINVTNFFRDPDFYRMLSKTILPALVKQRKTNDPLRVWVAGCATGEEAYSIAIEIIEYLEKKELAISFQIFASDLDEHAIEKSRLGIFSIAALRNVSRERLTKFFQKIDGHYQIKKSVRETCIFSKQNLLKDPPFSRMDLISCQNVLIYLENEPQQRILRTFHYALKPSGFLFLGKSESIGNAGDLFEQVDKKIRIYTRKGKSSLSLDLAPGTFDTFSLKERPLVEQKPIHDSEKEIGKMILSNFVFPCIILNESLTIVQFYGATAQYLSPVSGKASFNVLKIIREDLLIDLRSLLHEAKKTKKPTVKAGIIITNQNTKQVLDIHIVPKKTESETFYVIVFKEKQILLPDESKNKSRKKTRSNKDNASKIVRLEEELSQSRDLIKATNEEYETTYEELQANNEEILSSNEELQSINEELETSKEELQSSNEELTTINEELNKRNVELKESQNYAKAIVDTVNSPFLVVTSNLQVRIANKSFYDTFKLAPENTEGAFLYELDELSWEIPSLRNNLNDLLGKKPNYVEFTFENYFPRLGHLVFLVNAYRLSKEGPGKEALILLAFSNIGELQKTNLELKSVNEQLEQFVFASSHDLQEPLRKIETFSNLVAVNENMDPQIRKYFDKINASAGKMSILLNDLLSYSSLLRNKTQKPDNVDLNQTLDLVLKKLRREISDKKAVIETHPLPTIQADAGQMEQLFTHLIRNSLNFTRDIPSISITSENIGEDLIEAHGLQKGKRYIGVKFEDHGIGFDQRYVSKIFMIFQKLNDITGLQGSGIGLALCKKIVEDHGGIIIAEGRENKGATFLILLPKH